MPTTREATIRLADLLRREHLALADFLVALSAFHRERRWVELGYSSLFHFLTRELGLSKGAAYYRKTAAELVHAYPEVLVALRDGKLCLTSIVELSKVLTPENRAVLLPRFFHLSKREAKEVTAELLPAAAPPLRTVVTAVRGTGATDASALGRGDAAGQRAASGCSAVSALAAREATLGANLATPDSAFGRGFTSGAVHPANLVHASSRFPDVASADSSGATPGLAFTTRAVYPANLVHASSRVPGVASADFSRAMPPGLAFTDRAVHPANLVHASSRVPDVASAAATAAAPESAHRTEAEPLTAELTRLHVTVSRRLLEKLAAARDALSHSHPRASDDVILELGLDLIVARHRKRRGIGATPRNAERAAPVPAAPDAPPPSPRPLPEGVAMAPDGRAAPPVSAPPHSAPALAQAAPTAAPRPVGRSRHVPVAVWRAVWERDGGRCVWPVEGGGVCGSTRRLQLDHVDGWALGAETTADGCRLLCALHNDLHARALYGAALMNRYSRPKGARGAEHGVGA